MQTHTHQTITLISSRGLYWKLPAENIISGLQNKWGRFGGRLLVTFMAHFNWASLQQPLVLIVYWVVPVKKTRNFFRGSPISLSLPVWLMFWGGINTSLHACTEVNAWERWIALRNSDGFQKDGSGINNEFVLPSFFSVLVACFAAIK